MAGGVFRVFLIEIILILAVIPSGVVVFPSEKAIFPSGTWLFPSKIGIFPSGAINIPL